MLCRNNALAAAAVLLALIPSCGSSGRRRHADAPQLEPAAQVLGLAPVEVGGRDAPGGECLSRLLEDGLRELGWEVVEPEEARALLREMKESEAYNPLTGKLTEASYKERVHAYGLLASRFGVQGVVYGEIAPRVAHFEKGVASWDGARQAIDCGGGVCDPRARENGYFGEVDAVSLHVWVEDLLGRTVHEAWGGVELTDMFSGGRWHDVPRREQLRDAERLAAAAGIVIRELGEVMKR